MKGVSVAPVTRRLEVPNNLPLNLTPLVGREDLLGLVVELLSGSGSRLITLTGGPGMGKTRLATEVALAAGDTYPGGAWMVHLGPFSHPDMVLRAVSSVLPMSLHHGLDTFASLVAGIGDKRLLLVLDDCEHLVAGCAELAESLLSACPALVVLATSQEALGVAGERVWPVPGLAVADGSDPVALAASGAIRLFVDRAVATRPDFSISDEGLAVVADVCRRLDGIPLAIELAAARVAMFEPAEISDRIEDRFEFLTHGNRLAQPRHQALRAAVDWSYDLLSPPEQALLRRLAVFSGGCVIEAVEQVCSGGPVKPSDCLEMLTRLVSKSLVLAVPGDSGQPTRYRMLETIRQYALHRLVNAGETEAVAVRHLGWYASVAEVAQRELNGPDQAQWLAWLEAEHDNFRTALGGSLKEGRSELGLGLAGALVLFWRMRGHFLEGRNWLDDLLRSHELGSDGSPAAEPDEGGSARSRSAPSTRPASGSGPGGGDRDDDRRRVRALWGRGLMAAMVGDYAAAAADGVRSLALSQELDDRRHGARSLLLLGSCALATRGPTEGIPVLQQSVALSRLVGDTWCLAHALALCGTAFNQQGEVSAARPVLEECIVVARSSRDDQCITFGLSGLGYVALCEGDHEAATRYLAMALAQARATGGAYEIATALTDQAQLAIAQGEFVLARATLDEAIDLAGRIDSADAMVYAVEVSGRLAVALGDLDCALDLYNTSLELARQAQPRGTSVPALLGLAEVALTMGDSRAARERLSEALEAARAGGHKARIAAALGGLGDLARLDDDDATTAARHYEALCLRMEIGEIPGALDSLEAMAGVAARAGRVEKAARAFAATDALRAARGLTRTPRLEAVHQADLALVEVEMGAAELEAARATGRAMSIDEVVTIVSRGRASRRDRPETGWKALTSAELSVATLAAHGLTNAQIAEHLFVSVNTVKTHLGRVFAKLDVKARRDLTRRLMERMKQL